MRNLENFRRQLETEYARVQKFTPPSIGGSCAPRAQAGSIQKFDELIKRGPLQRKAQQFIR